MINNCPHCGTELSESLNDGLSQCDHCSQVFDSCVYNQLLAAAWQINKENLPFDKAKFFVKLDKDLLTFVYTFVVDHGYNHQEFMHLLKKLGVSKKIID